MVTKEGAEKTFFLQKFEAKKLDVGVRRNWIKPTLKPLLYKDQTRNPSLGVVYFDQRRGAPHAVC